VSQPIRDLAKAATEALIARLQGETNGPGKESLVQAKLIHRGSVSRAFVAPRVERRSRSVRN
jgi:LacI family transcriptional regulator